MTRLHGFWALTPAAAKWALCAAAFLLAVALLPFAILTIAVSVAEHLPPTTVIFGPMPGNPLIVWLYYTLPAAAIQGLAGLALRHALPGVRVAGIAAVLVLAAAALAWLGGIVYGGVYWLVTGATAGGDFADLLGTIFFGIPVLLTAAVLNVRAALLGTRDVLGHSAAPLPR